MPDSRRHPSPYPIQHAFVVQFEATTALDSDRLVGRVEHVVSGRTAHFQSMRALFEFVALVLQERQPSDDDEF